MKTKILYNELNEPEAEAVKLEDVGELLLSIQPDLNISIDYDNYDEYGCEHYLTVNGKLADLVFKKNYGGMFCPADYLECSVQTHFIRDSTTLLIGESVFVKEAPKSVEIRSNYQEQITAFFNENKKYLVADKNLIKYVDERKINALKRLPRELFINTIDKLFFKKIDLKSICTFLAMKGILKTKKAEIAFLDNNFDEIAQFKVRHFEYIGPAYKLRNNVEGLYCDDFNDVRDSYNPSRVAGISKKLSMFFYEIANSIFSQDDLGDVFLVELDEQQLKFFNRIEALIENIRYEEFSESGEYKGSGYCEIQKIIKRKNSETLILS